MDTLKEKKVVVGTFILAALIFIFSLFPSITTVKKNTPKNNERTLLASQILTISTLEDPNADPDKDTIPNWQETILGTDPHTKNTINKEALQVSQIEQKRLSDEGNMTVALAKNNLAVASYVQNLGTTTDINYEGISNDILQSTAESFSFKKYDQSILTSVVKSDQKNRKAYGNLLALRTAEMIKKYAIVDERVALGDIVSEKPLTKNVTALHKKIEALTSFKNFLIAMQVPDDAIKYHIDYINSVSHYLETLSAFENVNDDPLKAATLLRGYKITVQNIFTYFSAFENYFNKNYLVFSPKETGYIFTLGLKK